MVSRGVSRTVLSLLLTLVLLISTSPISAADFSSANPVLGNVSGIGNVQLRGISLSQEGTIFSGDHIRTGDKSYAKVNLSNGNRAQLSNDTEFVVNQGSGATRFGLASGQMGFTTSTSPMAISIGSYEILPKAGSNGTVGFFGAQTARIEVLSGSVMLREVTTKQSVVVSSGAQYIVDLKGKGPIAQLVSAIPSRVPVPEPQGGNQGGNQTPPASKPPKSGGISGKTIGILAAAGLGVVVIAVAAGGGNKDECDATCQAQKTEANRLATSIQTAADAAQRAIAGSLTIAAANSANTAITSLLSQLNTARTALSSATTASAATAALQSIQSLQSQLNAQLTTLRTTAGLPANVVNNIPPAASASIPI